MWDSEANTDCCILPVSRPVSLRGLVWGWWLLHVPLCGLFKCNSSASPSFKLLHRQRGTVGGLLRKRGHGPTWGQWGFREGCTWLAKSSLTPERWLQARTRLEGQEAAAKFSGTSTRASGIFIFFIFLVFMAMPCSMRDQFPNQESNLHPLHWKLGVREVPTWDLLI